MSHEALEAEVLRINSRYLTEVVEAYRLCPWAASVSDSDGLSRRVLHCSALDEDSRHQTLAVLEEVGADASIDIGLLIFPNIDADNPAFRRFVSSLEAAHAKAHPVGQTPLAMAAFHPQAAPDLETPARLVPFIRRSPDPTIQLVRRSTMERVRGGPSGGSFFAESVEAFELLLAKPAPRPSVSDGIATNNHRCVQRHGVETFERLFADIARDRDVAYARARLVD